MAEEQVYLTGVDASGNRTLIPLEVVEKSVHARPMPGTGRMARRRSLSDVTTREKAEFPSGANITEIWIFAKLEDGTAPATADALAAIADVTAMVAIDSTSDANADARLVRTNSGTDEAGFDDIPLNIWVRFPQTTALSKGSLGGGRVDVKSSDGTTSLSILIVGL